jgi:hypothetical protein
MSRLAAPALAAPALTAWALTALALVALAPGVARAAPKPLFASDEPLKLRIEAPFAKLLRSAPKSTEAYDAKLTVLAPASETLAISLSPRGISRRTTQACEFPPLRIEFKEKPGADSLFKGQKELKLATHCRNEFDYQDYGLLEFVAYRLNNVLTPQSFRVRLAEIDYVETGSSSVRIHRRGFLVEGIDELAARNGLKQVKTPKIEHGQLDPVATARSDLFQYMIGNQDWSDVAGPAGTHCCHNVNLLGKTAADLNGLVPVARDFDSSGWVNPPYALPPTNVPIRTVRQRFYRGYCQFNEQVKSAAQDMLAKRAALLDVVSGAPGLTSRAKNSATKYLQEFFDEISEPARLQEHILGRCRG